MRKITFIVNPNTSNKSLYKQEKVVDFFANNPNVQLSFHTIEYFGHLTGIVKDCIEDNVDTVVVVGGNGTVHEAVQSLVYTKVKLFIIPTGLTNSFTEYFDYPNYLEGSLKVLEANVYKSIDVGKATFDNSMVYFLNYLCIGISGEIVTSLKPRKINKYHQYFISGLKSVFKFNKKKLHLRFKYLDNNMFFNKELSTREVYIGNISSYGGFVDTFFISSVTDGILEIGIGNTTSIKIFKAIVNHFTNTGSGFASLADIFKTKSLRIELLEDNKVQVDWNELDLNGAKIIDIECCDGSLLMIAPNLAVF